MSRSGFGAVAFRDQIYVAGGIQEGAIGRHPVLRYDPDDDSWQTLNETPWLAIRPGLFVVDDQLYALLPAPSPVLSRYDPDTDSWSQRGRDSRGPAAAGRIEFGRSHLRGRRTLSEGDDVSVQDSTLVQNIAGDPWSRIAGASAANARWNGGDATAVSLQGRIYLLGGTDPHGNFMWSGTLVEVFTPG